MSLAISEPRERVAFLYWGAIGSADYPADLRPEAIEAVERVRKDGSPRDALVRGDGCLHVVCTLIERSPVTTRDSDAWLVVGPLEEVEAAHIARDAELIARGLQRTPRRLFKTTRLDAIPKASDSPAGWSIRRAVGLPQEGRLIVLEVPESTAPPAPPIQAGGPAGLVSRSRVWSQLRDSWPVVAAFLLGFVAGAVYQKVRAPKPITGDTTADPPSSEPSSTQSTDETDRPRETLELAGQNLHPNGDPIAESRVSSAKREGSR